MGPAVGPPYTCGEGRSPSCSRTSQRVKAAPVTKARLPQKPKFALFPCGSPLSPRGPTRRRPSSLISPWFLGTHTRVQAGSLHSTLGSDWLSQNREKDGGAEQGLPEDPVAGGWVSALCGVGERPPHHSHTRKGPSGLQGQGCVAPGEVPHLSQVTPRGEGLPNRWLGASPCAAPRQNTGPDWGA